LIIVEIIKIMNTKCILLNYVVNLEKMMSLVDYIKLIFYVIGECHKEFIFLILIMIGTLIL